MGQYGLHTIDFQLSIHAQEELAPKRYTFTGSRKTALSRLLYSTLSNPLLLNLEPY